MNLGREGGGAPAVETAATAAVRQRPWGWGTAATAASFLLLVADDGGLLPPVDGGLLPPAGGRRTGGTAAEVWGRRGR